MATKAMPPIRHAVVLARDVPAAIKKLERRLSDIKNIPTPGDKNTITSTVSTIVTKVNSTYDDVFGPGTVEANKSHVSGTVFFTWSDQLHDNFRAFENGRNQVLVKLQTSLDLFKERLEEDGGSEVGQSLRAYQNLDLHPEIARASSELYLDGHYANAVEDAVKALNGLVRLRSGIDDLDGSKLMTTVFSPENPVLRFNALSDVSDKDEQRGFMMLFAGAVAGLRNPRAHKFIEDDAERALEFIAFVSLLAKLLDGAKK